MSKKKKSVALPQTQAAPPNGKPAPIETVAASTTKDYGILAVAGMAILLYINTLGHGFVLDDDLAIKLHRHVPNGIGAWGKILFEGYREGNFGGQLYRPLPLMQFAFEWMLAPNSAGVHHFFQVFWYALLGIAVYKLAQQWFSSYSNWVALGGALLFVAHPIHTEVVANIKSRDELMCLLGCVAALWAWGKHLQQKTLGLPWWAAGFWLLALLSKEGAVALLPIFVAVAVVVHKLDWATSLKKTLPLLFPLFLFLGLRFMIFQGSASTLPDSNDNPMVDAQGISERLGTAFAVLWQYLKLLVWPNPLSSDYSFNALPVVGMGSFSAILGLFSYIAIAGLAIWGLMQRNLWGVLAFGYLSTMLLYSQLPFLIGTIFGERLVFTASLFFSFATVYGLVLLLPKFNSESNWQWNGNAKIFVGVVGLFVFGYGIKTITRNPVWHDNLSLFRTDVETYPNSVRLQNFVASQQLQQIATDSSMIQTTRDSLTRVAEGHLKASLAIRPTPTANLDMGVILQNRGDLQGALTYYKTSKKLFALPGIGERISLVLRGLASKAGEAGKVDEARTLLLEAQKENPKDAEVLYLLGVSYGVQAQHAQAAQYFGQAVQLNGAEPRYKSALQTAQNAMSK